MGRVDDRRRLSLRPRDRSADKPGEAAEGAELMAQARELGRSMAERLGLDPS